MWIAVTQRFKKFHENLRLTDGQVEEGTSHHEGVRKSLNTHYYGYSSETDNSFLTGSWGKWTRMRPPRDIDIYFILPIEVYNRFEQHSGNRQSQLLQEVRAVLQQTYPGTKIKGDGPVVLVAFNRMSVEVVPAFLLTSGQYWICDTKSGGRYMVADPQAEIEQVSSTQGACNNNLRPLVMMLKAWQSHCNVPLKSFYLELLANEFLLAYAHRLQGYFYYDWFHRDFFSFLIAKCNGYVVVPGTYDTIALGDAWLSKAHNAHSNALSACSYEYNDMVIHAGEEWQKIFGTMILVDPRD